jgi:hypothetical protein
MYNVANGGCLLKCRLSTQLRSQMKFGLWRRGDGGGTLKKAPRTIVETNNAGCALNLTLTIRHFEEAEYGDRLRTLKLSPFVIP